MSREAMKQALDALGYVMSHGAQVQIAKDILTQAIEQAEKQEPVAWLDAEMSQAYTIDELPDASGTGFLPLYTAPPKKEWVGLTDEEHDSIKHNYHNMTWTLEMFAKAIEAKLKEKNV